MGIANIQFADPWWLVALVLLPLLYFYKKKYRKTQDTLLYTQVDDLPKQRSWRIWVAKLLPWLTYVVLASGILALARPQQTLTEEKITAEGIDIILSLDLSSSMLAKDFDPNRLEASKRVALDFIKKRSFDRIGLVVFAGEAFTQCPLTTDHRILSDFLQNIQSGLLEDGTAIGMGLAAAVNRLKESEAKSKAIILLTDGVNNSGYIQPSTAVEIAEAFDIKVYTIGVGSNGPVMMPINRDSRGNYIFGMSRGELDESLLKEIADRTGGRYFRATDDQGLQDIYATIDALEKTEIEVTSFKRYKDLFRMFLSISMAALSLQLLLGSTWFNTEV